MLQGVLRQDSIRIFDRELSLFLRGMDSHHSLVTRRQERGSSKKKGGGKCWEGGYAFLHKVFFASVKKRSSPFSASLSLFLFPCSNNNIVTIISPSSFHSNPPPHDPQLQNGPFLSGHAKRRKKTSQPPIKVQSAIFRKS